MELAARLNQLSPEQFMCSLRDDRNVENILQQQHMPHLIEWRDKRLSSFMFSADFGFSTWALHAAANGSPVTPSFVGIGLTVAQAEPSTTEAVSKVVSVENYIAVKATASARILATLLSSQYGYRYITL